MRAALLMLLLALPSNATAGETPADSVAQALDDLMTNVPEPLRHNQVYLWNSEHRPEALAVATYALNCISSAETTVRPVHPAYADGRVNTSLIRVDLREMAPGDKEFARMFALWQTLVVNEPYYYALGNGEVTLEGITICGVPTLALKERVFGPHVPNKKGDVGETLIATTGNFAPIFRLDWFVSKVLSTLDGGRYYDFIGVVPGKTKLEEYLASHSASRAQAEARGTDSRVALVRSNVTGKSRAALIFNGSGVRPNAGTGFVGITDDIFDEDVDPRTDPIRQLKDMVARGNETILERRNGWHEWTLWDDKEVAVASAPDKLACDHRIPSPFTKRLESGISCIRCHAENAGLKPMRNDVQLLIGNDGFNAFGNPEDVRLLRSKYDGDMSIPLARARDTYAAQVFSACRLPIEPTMLAVASTIDRYRYSMVDTARWCHWLGLDVPQGVDPLTVLRAATGRRNPEDPIVRLAYQGVPINVKQAELIYTDMATRAAGYVAQSRMQDKETTDEVPSVDDNGATAPEQ